MRIRQIAVVVLAVVVLFTGCNGQSPTDPVTPPVATVQARLDFAMATTASHILRSAKMTFDGRDVAAVNIPLGGGQARFEANVDASAGRHVIRLVVLEQADSPYTYFGSGAITLPTKVLDLARVQRMLATGEAIEFNVDL